MFSLQIQWLILEEFYIKSKDFFKMHISYGTMSIF